MADILEPLKTVVTKLEKEQEEAKGHLEGAWQVANELVDRSRVAFSGTSFAQNKTTGQFYAWAVRRWLTGQYGLVIEVRPKVERDPTEGVEELLHVGALPPFGLYKQALESLETFIVDYTAEVLRAPTQWKTVE